jgi:hypothetical protein
VYRPTLRRGAPLVLEQHQTATENFVSVNGARVRRTVSINAALIRPASFSTVWPAPTAELELMLYPCTISAVNSSFDHDNPGPTPRVFDGGSRPRAAVAGCAGVMSSTSTGDGDGSGVGDGSGAASAMAAAERLCDGGGKGRRRQHKRRRAGSSVGAGCK